MGATSVSAVGYLLNVDCRPATPKAAGVEERDRPALIRRIKEAHFTAVTTLEEFNFQSASHIPVGMVKKLSEGE
jgi:hypothetical protein